MDEATALAHFRRWFVEPIEALKKLDNGDGGWVALIAAIALYQRLVKARLKLKGIKSTDAAIDQEVEQDLNLTPGERQVFWDMFRIGLMHGAMPKGGSAKWAFDHTFTAYPEFKTDTDADVSYICVHPMRFAERVLQEFVNNPKLIIASESFPWATIKDLPPKLLD